jgi:hypothetical protein
MIRVEREFVAVGAAIGIALTLLVLFVTQFVQWGLSQELSLSYPAACESSIDIDADGQHPGYYTIECDTNKYDTPNGVRQIHEHKHYWGRPGAWQAK